MILTCPSCGTRFLIEPTSLGSRGRRVRCGGCGHAWHQMPAPAPEAVVAPARLPIEPEEAEAAEPPLATPAAGDKATALADFDAARRLRDEGRQEKKQNKEAARQGSGRGSRRLLVAGWVALVVFVGALAAGAWFGRQAIVAQVPAAAKLYAAAGLPVEPEARIGEGLELRDVTTSKQLVDGQQTLHIKGAVVNTSPNPQPVPTMKAVITDAEGLSVAEWTFSAEAGDLPPGGSAPFETSTQEPESGANLSLIFVDNRS